MKDDPKVTLTILFILLIIILSIIPLTVNSDPILAVNDFSLYDYKEKANISENHILYIKNTGLTPVLIGDVGYEIRGSKEDIRIFNRCVDIKSSVEGQIIKFEGEVKEWGVYSIDIIPIINEISLDNFAWWNSSFGHYKIITVKSDFIDNDLINFPLTVKSTNTSMLEIMDDGDSVRFIAMDNTSEYFYDLDYFDDSVSMVFHVNISLSSSVDTKFLMYYNNSLVSTTERPYDVYDNNYLMVSHQNGGTGDDLDVTNYNNTLTEVGTVDDAVGNMGKARDYLGTDDYFTLPDFADANFGDSDLTMEVWFKPDTVNVFYRLIDWGGDSNLICDISLTTDADARIELRDSGNDLIQAIGGGVYTSSDWNYVVGTRDGDTGYIRIDDNAKSSNTNVDTDAVTKAQIRYIGVRYSGAYDYNGLIDEIRVSNICRNDSWVNASFDCQNGSDGFISLGDEYDVPVSCECLITVVNPVNNSVSIDWSILNLSVLVNSSLGCYIDFVNISLVNDTGYLYYINYSDGYSNRSFWLNDTFNLSSDTLYTWFVNASCDNNTNVSWFVFETFGVSLDDLFNLQNYMNNKMIGVDDELDINIGLDGTLLTLVLFAVFFIIGYTINKRSGGVLMLFSGFIFIAFSLLVSTVLNALLILPLLIPIGILIIILGVRKWLYPVENEYTKSEGT